MARTLALPRIDAAAATAAQTTATILATLFGPPAERDFDVTLWDGTTEPARGTARFTLAVQRPGAFRRMLLPPTELAMAEAYLRDDIDIRGDIEAATGLAEVALDRLRSPARLARLLALARALPADDREDATPARRVTRLAGRRHTRRRDRAAVRSHYDVGNDFYRLFLDERMVYSCAYFADPGMSLDTAQEAKLDHICRKLRLRPGERLLDIGCGWGSLVLHAAERYGVEATGITLSEPQAALARERIAKAGLEDRCRIEVRDYRELPGTARFDKIASVGMVEHVGAARLAEYFAAAWRLLAPGGLLLNHGIVTRECRGRRTTLRRMLRGQGFIDRYVFPDGELVPAGAIIDRAEAAGFETRDVESLREHYALTLRHWVRRLEARHREAVALVGEPTYRVWRLYMAGSARGFATGRLGIVQALLARPAADGRAGLPLTRADLYT